MSDYETRRKSDKEWLDSLTGFERYYYKAGDFIYAPIEKAFNKLSSKGRVAAIGGVALAFVGVTAYGIATHESDGIHEDRPVTVVAHDFEPEHGDMLGTTDNSWFVEVEQCGREDSELADKKGCIQDTVEVDLRDYTRFGIGSVVYIDHDNAMAQLRSAE